MLKTYLALVSVLSLIVILAGGYFHASFADEIVLDNGDRLTGSVTGADAEHVTLKTEYSEPITIKRSMIKMITTENPMEVHLKGGEVVKGSLTPEGNDRIRVEASGGREPAIISWEAVSAINPPPVTPSTWKGSVSIGAGHQSGNTGRTNASFSAEATRKTSQDRFGLRFLYNYAEDDDTISARNAYGAIKYDYFFTEVWYGYLGVELLNDRFKDLNLRTVVGPGIGYQVWDDSNKTLLFEGGISYFSEDLKVGEDDSWIAARLGTDLSYMIRDTIVFSDTLVIYPSLEDFGEYKLRNEAAITSPLGSGWALRLANILEQDSAPPAGIEKTDYQWILGMQYDF